MEKRWRIILNPAAGRGGARSQRAKLEALLSECAPPEVGWWVSETRDAGSATTLARAAVESGFYGVAAAGGDGTLHEVLNGLLPATASTRLAVLPLGTGNDFARCIGLGGLESAVRAMFAGEARQADVGCIHSAGRTQYFLNVAGCGFDAAVAARINGGGRLRGRLAYLATIAHTLARFRPVPLRLRVDDQYIERTALLCAVANATSYGGGMRIAPHASLYDGEFDVCVIGDAGPIEFLLAFPRVFRGKHLGHPKVQMLRGRRVGIASHEPLPVLADGELVAQTPVKFENLPKAVHVMVPGPVG